MPEIQWVLCPVCRNKTRLKIRGDTILINFPLYCPKCKQETLITAQNLNITIVKESDAQTQSRQANGLSALFFLVATVLADTTRPLNSALRRRMAVLK